MGLAYGIRVSKQNDKYIETAETAMSMSVLSVLFHHAVI
jgi:hypothetical protein